MRKIFAVLGLMTAAVISLVSCQTKEIVSESRTMTIIASSDLTKTANSGMSTVWADGDQLHVFYLDPAVATHASYVKAGVFTISDGVGTKSGAFTGEAASVPSAATKWFAIYTGATAAAPVTPAASKSDDGFVYVSRSNGIKQPSYDDMSTVSGSHCPMYGVAENVASGSSPSFTMKQIASVIEFKLVNKTGGTLVVNSLQFEEQTDVAGQYYLDITGSEPVLTAVEGRTVTNPTVTITKPAELAADAVAKIYLPVKPFKHAPVAGMKVTVSGTVNGKTASKSIGLNPLSDAQCTFAAGKIKTVTVNVSEMETEPDATFIFNTADGLAAIGATVPEAGSSTGEDVSGKTFTNKSNGISISFDKGSASNPTRIWNTAAGVLDLRAYNGSSMTITAPSGQSVTKIVFVGSAVSGFGSPVSSGVWEGDASSVELSVTATVKINTVTVTTKSGSAPPVTTDKLSADPTSLSFAAEGEAKTVTVTCNESNWTYECSETWLTISKASAFVGLNVTAAENTGDARNATITLKHPNGTLTATVAVSQKKASSSSSGTITLTPNSLIFDAAPTGPQTIEVTSDEEGWTWNTETVAEWVTLTKSGNNISVMVQNNTEAARNCTVKFLHANGTTTANLVINQKAPSSGNKVTYTKVTSGTIGTGDYLIVCEASGKALDGSLTDYSKVNSMAVTISGNTITIDEGSDIHYDATSKTIRSASGLYLGAKGNNANGMASRKTDPNGSVSYTIDMTVSGGVATIGCNLEAGFHPLKYNKDSDFFRFYKPTSSLESAPLSLYKKN
ncbi:MAG: BACON domain-containing protein [Bacteroidales bacterium]|nr:BACON domain-containing protein [Bacteroidales bacterium]